MKTSGVDTDGRSGLPAMAWVALGFLSVATSGCGPRIPLAEVTGKVTHNGQAVPCGEVMFVPVQGGPVSVGRIQPDGSFQLSTYEHGQGAVIGIHKVQVRSYDPDVHGKRYDEYGGNIKSLIPLQYTDTDTSGIQFEVQPKGNHCLIELKGELTAERSAGTSSPPGGGSP